MFSCFKKKIITPYKPRRSNIRPVKLNKDKADFFSSGNRINPEDFDSDPEIEWLFPETTKNYDRLLLQYRGCCGYSIVRNDRLLLPGDYKYVNK